MQKKYKKKSAAEKAAEIVNYKLSQELRHIQRQVAYSILIRSAIRRVNNRR